MATWFLLITAVEMIGMVILIAVIEKYAVSRLHASIVQVPLTLLIVLMYILAIKGFLHMSQG